MNASKIGKIDLCLFIYSDADAVKESRLFRNLKIISFLSIVLFFKKNWMKISSYPHQSVIALYIILGILKRCNFFFHFQMKLNI